MGCLERWHQHLLHGCIVTESSRSDGSYALSGGGPQSFGNVVYALLDDGATDDDYDDMIVRLTVTEVPEPTTLALAAAGMVPAVGWALRRRRRFLRR